MRDDDVKQWSIRSVLIKTIYKSGVVSTKSLLARTLFHTTSAPTPRPSCYTRGTRHLSPITRASSVPYEKYEPLCILYDYARVLYNVRVVIVIMNC